MKSTIIFRSFVPCFCWIFAATAVAENAGPVILDDLLLDEKLAEMTLVSVYDRYKVEVPAAEAEQQKKLAEELKKQGVIVPKKDPDGFHWMSAAKEGLRADPKRCQFLGKPVGEVLIRANRDKVGPVSVSLFNRGDDGDIPANVLAARVAEWRDLLDAKLGVKSTPRNDKTAANLEGWMWKRGKLAWLLESSLTKGSKNKGTRDRAEFLRLRLASYDAITVPSLHNANRLTLRDNVVKKDNGDNVIEGVPMVDQGQKGYCAVATFERVARYYGVEVDQHQMAQIANTSSGGTSMAGMEGAFNKLSRLARIRTTKVLEVDMKQFVQDVAAYNAAAKKEGKKTFELKRGQFVVHPAYFAQEMDRELYVKVKKSQPGYERFMRVVKSSIDLGIPVCWGLQLGMFPEADIPQAQGGHMRLIIGYNEKTEEIMYSDSWGKGHELKRMPAVHGCAMTMALLTMTP